MDCLDEETILGFIDGVLGGDRLQAVETHARGCVPCRERVSACFAAVDGPPVRLGPGTVIDRYRVKMMVGHGGMGEVYAAHDPKLDRMIALKLLHARAVAAGAAEDRLVREAQAIARLSHPNVITVYDVGTYQGRVYLAMEYVEGQTLASWVSERSRTPTEIIAAFREAARGLGAAHAAGLVHRDFKPQNVLVRSNGAVVVSDFGLARRVDGQQVRDHSDGRGVAAVSPFDLSLTGTGDLIGTPRYMAPEQLGGESLDARSDQFSFCVALYEGLYGEHPFLGRRPSDDGVTASALVAELCTALAAGAVRSAPPGSAVPSWVRALLLRGMSTSPAARWPSMDDLISTLARGPAPRGRRLFVSLAAGAAAAALAFALVHTPRPVEGEAARSPAAAVHGQGPALESPAPPQPAPAPEPGPTNDPPAVTVASSPVRLPSARRGMAGHVRRAAPRDPSAETTGSAGAGTAAPALDAAEQQLARGQIAEACALGQAVAARSPEAPAVWEFLGRCTMRLAEPTEARTYYRRYLALAPDGPNAAFIRAIVERERP